MSLELLSVEMEQGVIRWQWPLKVGFDPVDFFGIITYPPRWERFYQVQEFPPTPLYDPDLSSKHFNVVISDGHSWGPFRNTTIDILVILEYGFTGYHFGDLYEIARITNAQGILITDRHNLSTKWFEDVLYELSHNKNIVDVFSATVKEGKFLFNYQMISKTTITSVVRDLIEKTKGHNFELNVNNRITGNRTISGKELSLLLDQKLPSFYFDRESDEATDIAEISRALAEFVPEFRNMDPRHGKYFRQIAGIHFNAYEPRSLQMRILDQKNNLVNQLIKNRYYKIEARIGTGGLWLSASEPFPSKDVFEHSREAIEKLLFIFTSNVTSAIQSHEVIFPRSGDSSIVTFEFATLHISSFNGQLNVFHKSRLLQKATIKAVCIDENQPLATDTEIYFDVVFTGVKNLDKLDQRNEFGASLFYRSNDSNEKSLGVINNKPVELFLFNSGLEQIVKKIKDSIQDALVNEDESEDHQSENIKSKDLFHEDNVELLKKLAIHGNSIFVNYYKVENKFDGPLQIISQGVGFIPLDFIYELPVPSKEATLCKGAKESLELGKCGKCFDHTITPASFVCPFGFWAFNRVVERYAYNPNTATGAGGNYQVISPIDNRKGTLSLFNETVYGSTEKIEAKSPGLRNNLRDLLNKSSKHFLEAQDWVQWRGFTEKKKPDSLVLVVHLEHNEIYDVDELEIGNKQLLMQNEMDTTKLGEAPPFVIILGCEVTNVKTYGFDISNQLMNHKAAIVLSNFTKIRGRDAGPLIMELVELLKKEAKSEAIFGEILLKLRQQLLAKGMMASLSLLAHGDADWKIKTYSDV